jgi:hypothetical protein
VALLVAVEAFDVFVRFLLSFSVVAFSKKCGVGVLLLGTRPSGLLVGLINDCLHQIFGVQFLVEDTGSGSYC